MKITAKTSVMLIVGILLTGIAIGGCSDDGYNLEQGRTTYDSWDLDSCDNTIENDCDSIPFLDRVQNKLWSSALKAGGIEVGCYIYYNPQTGEETMGTIAYGSEDGKSITPGNQSPASNGVEGSGWEVSGYVHTHPTPSWIGYGKSRDVGPSNEDQLWADFHELTVYTIDYIGRLDLGNDRYYIKYNDAIDMDLKMYISKPYVLPF